MKATNLDSKIVAQYIKKTSRDPDVNQNAFSQKASHNYCYQATDIRLIQNEIMQPYLGSFIIHEPIGDGRAIAQTLTELISSLNDNKPTLCIYNLGNWHWVALAALKIHDEIYILYKDSKGARNEGLERQTQTISSTANKTAKFIVNPENEQTSGVECGIFALRNMEIMARYIVAPFV